MEDCLETEKDAILNGDDLMSTSTTSSNGGGGGAVGGGTANGSVRKSSITSPDPTAYVTKARVTRPTPPPPPYNPMQFVQIKPCNLYQTAQQQLKKAEEVKKLKEVKKEEPEDWQNNLDNWKSSRRKRVEHIIDRVVEVKKLELEEHDRTRRKSKTFSEMIEERAERGGSRGRVKLASLAVYNEDESNDLSDLGIGTSSASGKSSLSEDYDNNSVMSDNAAELDKAIDIEKPQQQHKSLTTPATSLMTSQSSGSGSGVGGGGNQREYISSPGYETSSSTAAASSPDPCEYTYEGAIQDYKQRVSRASSRQQAPPAVLAFNHNNNNNNSNSHHNDNNNGFKSKECYPESNGLAYPTRRGSKIEDRLIGFEVTSPSDHQEDIEKPKVDLPKIDISKRKEIFESQATAAAAASNEEKSNNASAVPATGVAPKVVLRERFTNATSTNGNSEPAAKKEIKRLSGDITSIRDRMQSLEQQRHALNSSKSVDVAVPPLKERLSSLQNAVTKEEVKKAPVALVDARQLEIMKLEEEKRIRQIEDDKSSTSNICPKTVEEVPASTAHDDNSRHIVSGDIKEQLLQKAQEEQLNAAIAALELEEQQLEAAANAVNQIEAEFEELTELNPAPLKSSPLKQLHQQANEPAVVGAGPQAPQIAPAREIMEFSINEALEVALEAIDRENNANNQIQQQQQIIHQLKQQQNQIEMPNKTDEEKNQIMNNNNNVTNKFINNIQQLQQPTNRDVNQQEEEEAVNSSNSDVNQKFQQQQQYTASMEDEDEIAEAANETAVENDEAAVDKKPNDDEEAKISKEPIYENINSATSMHDVDVDAKPAIRSIPKFIKSNDNTKIQQQQQQQQTHNISNNNNNNHNSHVKKKINFNEAMGGPTKATQSADTAATEQQPLIMLLANAADSEPYYQVPKSSEPYYDAPKHLRPIPVYENIEIFYNGLESSTISTVGEPPKEKPPPPPAASPPPLPSCEDEIDSVGMASTSDDTWSSTTTTTTDNTYETIATRRKQTALHAEHPSPPIKRMNSTKRIKKELRNKRSSFLGIDTTNLDDEDNYLELTVAPPPDMAQLLQEERRLEKQLYIKAGLCDSSDTGESRDSGVSENHSRQSSEHYTSNSSEEHDPQLDTPPPHSLKSNELIYQNESLLSAAQTPLLQTVKGNSAESWTESATVAAAATQSLSETANAKMLSIEEKIREQEEVLRVERELLHFSQEELKRQRENLLVRENLARRELQHGAKMLMSANRRSLQDLHGLGGGVGMSIHNGNIDNSILLSAFQPTQQALHKNKLQQPLPTLLQQQQQQIYANIPNTPAQPPPPPHYYQVETDYRKSMSDLNEFSKRLTLLPTPPTPPTKPLRAMHIASANDAAPPHEYMHVIESTGLATEATRQRHSLNLQSAYGGSLVKIAAMEPTPAPRGHNYAVAAAAAVNHINNGSYHHQSAHNLTAYASNMNNLVSGTNGSSSSSIHHGNMTRNTLHALSATPKPKYTDGWVQVQQRKSFDNNLTNDAAWQSAQQTKRKSMPESMATSAGGYNNGNHWLVQEAEQRRIIAEQRRLQAFGVNTPMQNGGSPKSGHNNNNNKPLPDAIIQTLTERVQSKGIGERKRIDVNYNQMNSNNNASSSSAYQLPAQRHPSDLKVNSALHHQQQQLKHVNVQHNNNNNNNSSSNHQQDKVLSVSGKKKCSHCGDELGRGAAMIIESLLLFYHINCFKCCVCHVQLGDGLNGTDVRVRHKKLHCQNCYSSDDGIKFSCV